MRAAFNPHGRLVWELRQPKTVRTFGPGMRTHYDKHVRVSGAQTPGLALKALLDTVEWKGSEVVVLVDDRGRRVASVRHRASGARANIFLEHK